MPSIDGVMCLSWFGSQRYNQLISDTVRHCACQPLQLWRLCHGGKKNIYTLKIFICSSLPIS